MSLFPPVALNPNEIKELADKYGGRAIMAVLTTQTCGEACWHAREEVCRCSCGGRNHGCLKLNTGGAAPERTSKINGEMYRLAGVGFFKDLIAEAREINRSAGWRSVEKPSIVIDGIGQCFTEADAATARAAGQTVTYSQYRYSWNETIAGAPARLKTASASQMKWRELEGWKDQRGVYLLWTRITMPARPAQLIVDKHTGEPIADQNPTR